MPKESIGDCSTVECGRVAVVAAAAAVSVAAAAASTQRLFVCMCGQGAVCAQYR